MCRRDTCNTRERVKETLSYFSLTPFGYANVAPLITATRTVAIFLLSLFSLKKKGCLLYTSFREILLAMKD